MVSKVAVMAIVGILAVPILLGFALNLEEVTETDYRIAGEAVNVTELLQNDMNYSYAEGDTYNNNTSFGMIIGGELIGYLPEYQGFSTTKSSLPLNKVVGTVNAGATQTFSGFMRYYYQVYSGTTNITIYTLNSNNQEVVFTTVTNLKWFDFEYIDSSHQLIEYAFGNAGISTNSSGIFTKIVFSGTTYGLTEFNQTTPQNYVDFAAGFLADTTSLTATGSAFYLATPNTTKQILITFNLDTITSADYLMRLSLYNNNNYILLTKTTTGTDISWTAAKYTNNTLIESFDLYYDPTKSDNTYQFSVYTVEPSTVPNNPYNFSGYAAELRYVGGWPTNIGEANYYQIYKFSSWFESGYTIDVLPRLIIKPIDGAVKTPVMRVDGVTYRAFEYPVINNRSYDPTSFRVNPATTISDPTLYGSSIEFGGNTYTVTKGNITLGTHQVPVKGLVLSSVPNGSGGYVNKIGNTVISTTAAPSAITFNGKWSASISTIGQEEYEYSKTEWIAGGFAWDGIDDNFLMVGLITSLGAFVALAIYARRTRASIWPLILVCGGAAILFFIMI